MNIKTFILAITILNFTFSQCEPEYSYFDELPYSVSILSGDSCFYNQDLNVINEVILLNELTYDFPLEVGTQLWFDGRLRSWVAGNYFGGVNAPLDTLPQNFGDLNDLRILYLEKNNIHYMPESFGNLTNLISFFISDNGLTNIIDNIGDLTQLYFLDLGYNQISVLPSSIVTLENLNTLYLFNNLIETIPEGFCDLNLDWDGYDPFGTPYFAIGGNRLCEDVPDCVINSANFEISLEPAYYLFPINMPQDCAEENTSHLVVNNFTIEKAFPNPFNPSITIPYFSHISQNLSINIINLKGELIDSIIEQKLINIGYHEVVWNANNIPSGIYFINYETQNSIQTQKIILEK